jgi:hypothetical protein
MQRGTVRPNAMKDFWRKRSCQGLHYQQFSAPHSLHGVDLSIGRDDRLGMKAIDSHLYHSVRMGTLAEKSVRMECNLSSTV